MASTPGGSGRESLVRRSYDDINRRGVRAAIEQLWAPEVVFVDIPELPDGGEHRGREAAVRHIEEFFATWTDTKVEVRETVEEGDRVAIRVVFSGKGRSSGVTAELEIWHVGIYRGDRAVRVEAYTEANAALAALRR